MLPRYWRREAYEEEDGPITTNDTTSPGVALAVGHIFGPYEEDTYIRGLCKAIFSAWGGTQGVGEFEFYDDTNNVRLDASTCSLSETAPDLKFQTPSIMWEGLLVAGNQLILIPRFYKGGGLTNVRTYFIKAWYEVARE